MSVNVLRMDEHQESSCAVVEGLRPLIPPGVYQLAYIDHYTTLFRKAVKVVMRFRVVDQGEYFGVVLERFYNAKRLIGKAGKNGRFKIGPSSDLLREFCSVAAGRVTRLDRLPLSAMKNWIIKGEVHTVEQSWRQEEIPQCARYSVIRKLIGVET